MRDRGDMSTTARPQPEQLQLLEADRVPLALRLDERTRRIGLAGVAAARAVLAENHRRRIAAEKAATQSRRPQRAA
jgi:hypothetical protein